MKLLYFKKTKFPIDFNKCRGKLDSKATPIDQGLPEGRWLAHRACEMGQDSR